MWNFEVSRKLPFFSTQNIEKEKIAILINNQTIEVN